MLGITLLLEVPMMVKLHLLLIVSSLHKTESQNFYALFLWFSVNFVIFPLVLNSVHLGVLAWIPSLAVLCDSFQGSKNFENNYTFSWSYN